MLAVIGFILTIGILVLFHEFGHYLVARIFGVKVITFSIGFGPKLLSINSKHNEWRISAIPLGGYVRMLDAREGKVPDSEQHLAFNYKKPYQKILIALAGPAFNFLFAFLAYYVLAMVGVQELKPVISSINPELTEVNQINIMPTSQIKKINGIDVYSWNEADKVFNAQSSETVYINLEYAKQQQLVKLNLAKARQHFGKKLYLESIGLYPVSYLSVISYVEPDSPAMKSGLRINDEIEAVDGEKIKNWYTLTNIVQNSSGKLLNLTIIRDKKRIEIGVRPEATENDGQISAKLGIMPTVDSSLLASNSILHKYNIMSAFKVAATNCYSVVMLNLTSLYYIVSGQTSYHNLGGPITIARVASGALAEGLKDFVDFLALISIGLGVMNLLPLPVLDGGHILIYALEWVLGKEITYQAQNIIFKIGLILIVGITIIAFYNDLLRL